jgi:hypothetical protein
VTAHSDDEPLTVGHVRRFARWLAVVAWLSLVGGDVIARSGDCWWIATALVLGLGHLGYRAWKRWPWLAPLGTLALVALSLLLAVTPR